MNATKLAKALLVLSFGLGSVALALHEDNADRRDELETLNERLQYLETVQWNYEVNTILKATAQCIQDWLDRYFTA